MKLLARLCLGMVVLLGTAAGALAYPDRPITLIIPYPAGGATDAGARAMVPFLERSLGVQLIVVNRPGAGGEIGFAEIARARPDGYTIGFINTPNVITIPIERRARYAMENFAPLANILDDPDGVAVRPQSEFRTLADVIAFAKANPRAVSYGTTGIGSDDHLAALEIERMTGVRMTHVPFAGGAQVRTALAGGHITLGIYNMAEMVGDLRNGVVRSLGQMSAERWSGAADVPTLREQGFDVVMSATRGMAAPAGIPDEVRDRLGKAIEQVVNDPAFQEIARKHPLPLAYLGPREYAAMLSRMQAEFTRLWAATPWQQ